MKGVKFFPLETHKDHRGTLAEIFRSDWSVGIPQPAMVYMSFTNPGLARGPHEHTKQTDCFVFAGPGDFMLYLWDNRNPDHYKQSSPFKRLVGLFKPTLVTIPPGIVHAYVNVSNVKGLVVNMPDCLYGGFDGSEPVDEIRHEENPQFEIPTMGVHFREARQQQCHK